jgi:prepilin-type N-terminal cleavage/methylation domain-containing protein
MIGANSYGPNSDRRGFTLIELMVAALVGSIVIAGIYLLYDQSVKAYRIQDQSLDALGQLRAGMHQLKTDLRSAGYNAPSQTDVETWVTTPPGMVLSAVAIEVDPNAPVIESSINTSIVPQRVRILGDFWSHRTYTTEAVAGQTVTLRWGPEDGDQREFERVFNNRRLLRIETYGVIREEQLIPIAAANYAGGLNPSVTLDNAVQGIGGFGTGNEVSVVGYIRYRLKRDTRRTDNSSKVDLIREELMPSGLAAEGSALIIAENIVDFQVYDICMNTQPPATGTMIQRPIVPGVSLQCFPNLVALNGGGVSLAASANNQSHMLRSLAIKLSARTPYEDPDIPFAPRQVIDEPLRAYELDPLLPGAARVFELAAMTTLTGIQARRQ